MRQELGDALRVFLLAIEPQRERLGAAQQQVRIERAESRAFAVLDEVDLFGERLVVDGDDAGEHVAVPAERLRRRMNNDICAERERVLQIG